VQFLPSIENDSIKAAIAMVDGANSIEDGSMIEKEMKGFLVRWWDESWGIMLKSWGLGVKGYGLGGMYQGGNCYGWWCE
jgi:hypothetical protein